jgi:type I restriction enzyme R subunit
MPTPGEHKTVQARILAYAEAIGWTIVSREEAERRRGFEPSSPSGLRRSGPEVPPADRARNRSLFFDDLLDAKVREFNLRYAEEKRERDLILIDSNQKKEAHHD